MESFLQCNYLCTVQCVYGREEKKTKMHFGLYIIYINIYKDKRIFQYQLEKLFSKIRTSLDVLYSFHIRLISRPKANTIHTLIIKYSHNNRLRLVCIISTQSRTNSAFPSCLFAACRKVFPLPGGIIIQNRLLFVLNAPHCAQVTLRWFSHETILCVIWKLITSKWEVLLACRSC